jgi:excisionase family DNA binding protein
MNPRGRLHELWFPGQISTACWASGHGFLNFTQLTRQNSKSSHILPCMNERQQNTRLLKAEDIAVMLGLKVQTVYIMARRGELEKVKLSRRCLRFRADDVERFIERKAGVSL